MSDAVDEHSTANCSGSCFSASKSTSVPVNLGSSTFIAAARCFIWMIPPPATPAAWMTPSMGPKRSRVTETTACMAETSATSAGSGSTSAPSASSRSNCRILTLTGSLASCTASQCGQSGRDGMADLAVRTSFAPNVPRQYSARQRPTPPCPPVIR